MPSGDMPNTTEVAWSCELAAPHVVGAEGTDHGLFKDEWRFIGSRVFLQVLELNGHGSIGFQEFQELKVQPFQAIFAGQQGLVCRRAPRQATIAMRKV